MNPAAVSSSSRAIIRTRSSPFTAGEADPSVCANRLAARNRLTPSSSAIGFQASTVMALPALGLQPLVRNAICTAEANGLTLMIRAIASMR
jgi:hypothetical protein